MSQALKERYSGNAFRYLMPPFEGLARYRSLSLGRCPGVSPGWIIRAFQASRCSGSSPMFPVIVRWGDGAVNDPRRCPP
jgi:hypothetical protein